MSLIGLVLALVVVGVVVWLVNTYVPMDAKIKQVLNVAVVVATILWLLQVFGLINYANEIRIGG